jgi:transcriptional regulator with XRE-family HTH domain
VLIYIKIIISTTYFITVLLVRWLHHWLHLSKKRLYIKMTIGERIKEVRGSLSRDVFAEQMGVVRNTVQRYEMYGTRPHIDFIESICKAYKINADWLIFGKGPKYTDQLPVAEVDQDTLIAVISSLEEALEANNKKMEPDKKAEVIAMLYEIITEEERRGEGVATLGRLIKLAV